MGFALHKYGSTAYHKYVGVSAVTFIKSPLASWHIHQRGWDSESRVLFTPLHAASTVPPRNSGERTEQSVTNPQTAYARVHLAELSNDPLSELNERTTYEINHHGSVTLARACKQAGCKVLVERDIGVLADTHFSPVFLRDATAFGASPTHAVRHCSQ
jgi:hypothetical protein